MSRAHERFQRYQSTRRVFFHPTQISFQFLAPCDDCLRTGNVLDRERTRYRDTGIKFPKNDPSENKSSQHRIAPDNWGDEDAPLSLNLCRFLISDETYMSYNKLESIKLARGLRQLGASFLLVLLISAFRYFIRSLAGPRCISRPQRKIGLWDCWRARLGARS